MKLIRVMTIAAAMVAVRTPASATEFLYSGSVESYVIPTSGYYALTVAGAQGGGFLSVGGGGAVVSGDIYLSNGTVLSVLAGGAGLPGNGDSANGGGGMSFISIGASPIVVAAGGGGANWFVGEGGPGLIGTSFNGVAGQGGSGPGAGAGWFTDSNSPPPGPKLAGGGRTGPTWAGGAPNVGFDEQGNFYSLGGAGGFGGGGGGGYDCGGGGGGYSGGMSCTNSGGGSFVSPGLINVVALSGANRTLLQGPSGNYLSLSGYIDIALSAIPEPDTWLMMLVGFGGIGAILRSNARRCTAKV